MLTDDVHAPAGGLATVEVQVLDASGLPVPHVLVYFDLRGTALGSYEAVTTFPVWTDATGVATLQYGYRGSEPSVIVTSEDVVIARALSAPNVDIGLVRQLRVQSVTKSRTASAVDVTWIFGLAQVNLATEIDACDVPVQCDPLGIPDMNCITLCEPPNICNVNCDVPPDPCVASALCEAQVPDTECIVITTDCGAHYHINYPRVPNGRADIVKVFGNACNPKTEFNSASWHASDGATWPFQYHKKLGGRRENGSLRSSVFTDVKEHIKAQNLRKYVKSGIFAHHCRPKGGTSEWSTHAWGIAWDISAAYEHAGHNNHQCHLVKWETGVPSIWENHSFYWGRNFSTNRDCMHFQYATGY